MSSEVVVDTRVEIQTKFGVAEAITFRNLSDAKEHILLGFGDWQNRTTTKVRIHSECLTGDVFGSERCDCGPQLQEAMQRFSKSGGVIIYLRQEGRGIGLLNKMKAYKLQDQGMDTYEANRQLGFAADLRDFTVAAEMLRALKINKVCLLSNNPLKAASLEKNGIQVIRRLFTSTHLKPGNHRYLRTKSEKGGHDGLDVATEEDNSTKSV